MNTTYTPSVSTAIITNGGTAQIIASTNNLRKAIRIQALTEVTTINFGATAGIQATGTYTIGVNPSDTDTIAFNGTTFEFVNTLTTGPQIKLEATLAETIVNAVTTLNEYPVAGIQLATYSNPSPGVILVTYKLGGTDGNAYTLGTNTANIVRSAATLANGSNTGGGFYLAQFGVLELQAKDFPSIQQDVYALCATNNSQIAVLESNG